MKLQKQPKIPYDSWNVHYHDGKTSFDPKSLQLHLEPEQEKGYINGHILAARMKGKGLNSNVMDYLYEHQELIPKEWIGKYVYFWGTIFADDDDDLFVRYFCWYDGGVCDRGYCYLGRDWYSRSPAAVSASISSKKLDAKSSALVPLNLDLAIAEVKKAGYVIYKEI